VIETEFEGLLSQRLPVSAEMEKARTDTASRYLRQVAGDLAAGGLEVETEHGAGSPAREILDAAERDDVAMVVMATHGRGGTERRAIGSVADKVLRMGVKPTLLVRPHEASRPAEPLMLNRILVPLDGSTLADAALEPARDLALATGVQIILLRVLPELATSLDWGSNYIPELAELEVEMGGDAKKELDAIIARLPGIVEAETVVLRGPATVRIEDYVKSHRIDLTVMTTHGRGGLARLVLGKMAARLVHSGASVLVIHPRPAEGETDATPAGQTAGRQTN
jgi:nucleotide-binding universal stress UspA family protein